TRWHRHWLLGRCRLYVLCRSLRRKRYWPDDFRIQNTPVGLVKELGNLRRFPRRWRYWKHRIERMPTSNIGDVVDLISLPDKSVPEHSNSLKPCAFCRRIRAALSDQLWRKTTPREVLFGKLKFV